MQAPDAAPRHSARSWFSGPAGRRYGWQLTLVVIAKLVALTVLYFAFIAPQPRADTSPRAVQQHLLDTESVATSNAPQTDESR